MAKLDTKYQIPQLLSVWQHTVLILILSHLQCICPIWNCSFRQQLISRPNGPLRAFSFLLILKQASDEQIKSSEKDNQLVTWSIALCTKYKCGPGYQAPTSAEAFLSRLLIPRTRHEGWKKDISTWKKTWQGMGEGRQRRHPFSLPFSSHLKFKWSPLTA